MAKQVVDALVPTALVLDVAAFTPLRELGPPPLDIPPNLSAVPPATISRFVAVAFVEQLATESVQGAIADLVSVALLAGAVDHALVR